MSAEVIRCSRLPLVMACPASLDCTIAVESTSEEAANGTAVHACLADWVRDGLRPDAVADYAMEFDADPEEVARLAYTGWKLWREQLQHWFRSPSVEMQMKAGILTGRADIVSLSDDGETVLVGDWKSNRVEVSYRDQLRGYAWCALQHAPSAKKASGTVIWIRDQAAETEEFTREQLDRWYDDLAQIVESDRHAYRPGTHCAYCPRFVECPARSAMVQNAVGEILDHAWCSEPPALVLADLLDRVKLVEKACGDARDMIRAATVAAGGRLDIEDGRELVIMQQERRTVRYEPAASILAQELDSREVCAVLSVNKTDLEKIVRDRAPRGQKMQAVQALMEKLDGAGAIETKTDERLELRRNGNTTAAVPAISDGDGAGR